MNLHDHFSSEAELLYFILNPDHRKLNEICCRPLERTVDRHSLGRLTDAEIRGMDVRQITAAMEKGHNISLLPRLLQSPFRVGPNAWVSFKIFINIGLGDFG